MAVPIRTVDDLGNYLNGMLANADHHAYNIEEVVLKLVGAVVMLKDPGTVMECRAVHGETANVVWVYINGTRYAFAYQHNPPAIEIRERSLRGPVVASFDNSQSMRDVLRIVRGL